MWPLKRGDAHYGVKPLEVLISLCLALLLALVAWAAFHFGVVPWPATTGLP